MGLGTIKTAKRAYLAGYGMSLTLAAELPRKYDEKLFGDGNKKGLTLSGTVTALLGAEAVAGAVPKIGEVVNVVVRPNDVRRTIFDDLEKTKEGSAFLLEGVSGDGDSMTARWVHGAGSNRSVQALEIVGVPHVSFENPVKDGPRSGYLRLALDGSPTTFDERTGDGEWVTREIAYETVVERLGVALERDLRVRVSQRAMFPSLAKMVSDQDELERTLSDFRADGMTSCVVRTFIKGTTDPSEVDIQVMSWPTDVPARGTYEAATYEMPVLNETKRFVAVRDHDDAVMEVIPGFVLSLVGNPTDTSKSVKHKFCADIVKGLSDKQKTMYGNQTYGPGFSIRAVNDDGEVLGMVRLASRTEGPQFRNLISIPSANFDAAAIKFNAAAPAATNEPPAQASKTGGNFGDFDDDIPF